MPAELVGVAELVQDLRRAEAELARLDLTPGGRAIEERAAANAPEETGRLARSGRVLPVAGGVEVRFGSSALPYAIPQHFGSGPRRPQGGSNPAVPFLFDAADSEEPAVVDLAERQVDTTLTRLGL